MPEAAVVPFTEMVLLMLMWRDAVNVLMFSPVKVTGPLSVMSPVPAPVPAVTASEKLPPFTVPKVKPGVLIIVLLAVSVPVLLICAVQYFTAGPPIPEDVSIVGGVDMATDIYVMGRFPSHLFLAALPLFVVGLGVLIGLKIKRWKGKTHDR